MRSANLRLERVLGERRFDPRDQIAAIRFVVRLLKLAAAALGKEAAGRILVMRAGRERSVVEQRVSGDAERNVSPARRYAVAPGCDADDQLMGGGERRGFRPQLPASSSARAFA